MHSVKKSYVLTSEEFFDSIMTKTQPSLLRARNILAFFCAPILGLYLTFYGGTQCCFVPSIDYSMKRHGHSTSLLIWLGCLLIYRALIYVLLCVAGALLFFEFFIRQYVRNVANDRVREQGAGERSIEISPVGMRLRYPFEKRTLMWRNVKEIFERDRFVYITLVGQSWFAIPKRVFRDSDEIASYIKTVQGFMANQPH